jgi:hypothetical protein
MVTPQGHYLALQISNHLSCSFLTGLTIRKNIGKDRKGIFTPNIVINVIKKYR